MAGNYDQIMSNESVEIKKVSRQDKKANKIEINDSNHKPANININKDDIID
jgi:hypothetical protein